MSGPWTLSGRVMSRWLALLVFLIAVSSVQSQPTLVQVVTSDGAGACGTPGATITLKGHFWTSGDAGNYQTDAALWPYTAPASDIACTATDCFFRSAGTDFMLFGYRNDADGCSTSSGSMSYQISTIATDKVLSIKQNAATDQEVQVVLPSSGYGGGFSMTNRAGTSSSCSDGSFSFCAPVISQISASTTMDPTDITSTITLQGSHFFTDDIYNKNTDHSNIVVFSNPTRFASRTSDMTYTSTQLEVLSPGGVGTITDISIEYSATWGDTNAAASHDQVTFAAPSIDNILPTDRAWVIDGGTITLQGSFFPTSWAASSYQPSDISTNSDAFGCLLGTHDTRNYASDSFSISGTASDSTVVCGPLTAATTSYSGLNVVATMNGASTSAYITQYSYYAPTITGVGLDTDCSSVPTRGHTTGVYVCGTQLTLVTDTNQLTYKIGTDTGALDSCTLATQADATAVLCSDLSITQGFGSDWNVQLTIDGRSSSATFSYRAPTITMVTHSDAADTTTDEVPWAASQPITLQGESLACSESTCSTRLNAITDYIVVSDAVGDYKVAYSDLSTVTNTEIAFDLTQWHGDNQISINQGQVSGATSATCTQCVFCYKSPTIDSISEHSYADTSITFAVSNVPTDFTYVTVKYGQYSDNLATLSNCEYSGGDAICSEGGGWGTEFVAYVTAHNKESASMQIPYDTGSKLAGTYLTDGSTATTDVSGGDTIMFKGSDLACNTADTACVSFFTTYQTDILIMSDGSGSGSNIECTAISITSKNEIECTLPGPPNAYYVPTVKYNPTAGDVHTASDSQAVRFTAPSISGVGHSTSDCTGNPRSGKGDFYVCGANILSGSVVLLHTDGATSTPTDGALKEVTIHSDSSTTAAYATDMYGYGSDLFVYVQSSSGPSSAFSFTFDQPSDQTWDFVAGTDGSAASAIDTTGGDIYLQSTDALCISSGTGQCVSSGGNFLSDKSSWVTFGHGGITATACEAADLNTMKCTIPAGSFGNVAMTVFSYYSGSSTGKASATNFSYKTPTITGVTPNSGITAHSFTTTTFTLTGSNFGGSTISSASDYEVKLSGCVVSDSAVVQTVTDNKVEFTIAAADTTANYKSAGCGIGKADVALTIGQRVGTGSTSDAYVYFDPPTGFTTYFCQDAACSAPTTTLSGLKSGGGTSTSYLSISGSSFGVVTSDVVIGVLRSDNTWAYNDCFAATTDHAKCYYPPGYGTGTASIFNVNNAASTDYNSNSDKIQSSTFSVTFQPPTISNINGGAAVSDSQSMLSITGTDFPTESSLTVTAEYYFKPSDGSFTRYDTVTCVTTSTTLVQCANTGGHGAGQKLTLNYGIGSLDSTALTFATPTISSVTVANAAITSDATYAVDANAYINRMGSTTFKPTIITIGGSNFFYAANNLIETAVGSTSLFSTNTDYYRLQVYGAATFNSFYESSGCSATAATEVVCSINTQSTTYSDQTAYLKLILNNQASANSPTTVKQRCPPGSYYVTNNHQCVSTSAGQQVSDWNQISGGTVPKDCGTGFGGGAGSWGVATDFAAPSPVATMCTECDRGYYAPTVNEATCTPCAAGTRQNQRGKASCDDCAAGEYQDLTAQLTCKDCPAGSITTTTGLSSCTPCDGGYSTNDATAQAACTICDANTYSNQGDAACTNCPANTYTTGQGTSGAGNCLCVASFWKEEGTAGACDECLPAVACDANSVCATGYDGVRCADCAGASFSLVGGDKYFKMDDGTCSLCPSTGRFNALIVGILVVCVAVCMMRAGRAGGSGFLQRLVTPTMQILKFAQLVLMTIQIDIAWPGYLTGILSIPGIGSLSSMSMSVASPECAVTLPHYLKFFFLLSLPFVFMFMYVVIALIVWPLYIKKLKKLAAVIVRSFFFMMLMLYVPLVNSAFQPWDCTKGSSGSLFMDSYPTYICFESTEWWYMVGGSAFGLSWYGAGLPLLWLTILLISSCRPGLLHGGGFYEWAFGFLYTRYEDRTKYWEILELLWKLAIVLTKTFLTNTPWLQLVLNFIILLSNAGLKSIMRPYLMDWEDSLATIVIVANLTINACGIYFYFRKVVPELDIMPLTIFFGVLMGVAIFVVVVCTIGCLIFSPWLEKRELRKKAIKDKKRARKRARRKGKVILDDDDEPTHAPNDFYVGDFSYDRDGKNKDGALDDSLLSIPEKVVLEKYSKKIGKTKAPMEAFEYKVSIQERLESVECGRSRKQFLNEFGYSMDLKTKHFKIIRVKPSRVFESYVNILMEFTPDKRCLRLAAKLWNLEFLEKSGRAELKTWPIIDPRVPESDPILEYLDLCELTFSTVGGTAVMSDKGQIKFQKAMVDALTVLEADFNIAEVNMRHNFLIIQADTSRMATWRLEVMAHTGLFTYNLESSEGGNLTCTLTGVSVLDSKHRDEADIEDLSAKQAQIEENMQKKVASALEEDAKKPKLLSQVQEYIRKEADLKPNTPKGDDDGGGGARFVDEEPAQKPTQFTTSSLMKRLAQSRQDEDEGVSTPNQEKNPWSASESTPTERARARRKKSRPGELVLTDSSDEDDDIPAGKTLPRKKEAAGGSSEPATRAARVLNKAERPALKLQAAAMYFPKLS